MQQLITNKILNQDFEVHFLDISDRRGQVGIAQWDFTNIRLGLKHAAQCLAILLRQRPAVLYLGISQGLAGLLRDLLFILPAMMLRTRVILHLRGSEFREFYHSLLVPVRQITKAMLARCAVVIVLGECLRPIFAGLVDPDRIAVIPNGIDHSRFARQRTCGRSGQQILLVSSLRKRKGVFLVLKAMPAILRRHPGATLTIVGKWRSPTEEQQARQMIDAGSLSGAVRFAGELVGAEKIRAYQEHDLFLFTPVEPEGLPWVILEAMSSALPVVTTAQGCIPEVVEHGRTGLICEPKPSAVSGAVNALLDDPESAASMGNAGLNRIRTHFSEQAYIGRLMDVFSQVARTSGCPPSHRTVSAPPPTELPRSIPRA